MYQCFVYKITGMDIREKKNVCIALNLSVGCTLMQCSFGIDGKFYEQVLDFDERTDLLFVGQGARGIVEAAFGQEPSESCVRLEGVVSRKKQVLGPLMNAIEKM